MEAERKAYRLVKPKHNLEKSRRIIPLSTCDLAMPNVYTMAIYAFRAAPNKPSNVVSELERGLAEALDEYPEWAGRLAKEKDHGGTCNQVYIDLTADGVALMEASMDCCVEDLMPFDPSPLLFQLVPDTQDQVEELLLIQVTSLNCGGIVLGVAWHHRVADGQAFFSFMENWARITRGVPISCTPSHDRSALMARDNKQPLTDDYKLLAPPPAAAAAGAEADHPPISVKKFHFGIDVLQKIKKTALADHSSVQNATVTTFESLTAHLWRCITEARGLQGEVRTQIMIAMNGRARLNPALPESYFGNATFMPSSGAEAEELTSRPLSYAAQLVHSAIEKADNDYLRSAIDSMEIQNQILELMEVLVPPSMSPDVVVTSWVRFPLYDVDFGWGAPLFVGNVANSFEGIMVLLPSYTRDGSIDAVVALFEQDMGRLEELCYNGI